MRTYRKRYFKIDRHNKEVYPLSGLTQVEDKPMTRMETIARNSGRRAFLKGWTTCIFKRPEHRAAWYCGYQDEQDDFMLLNRA